MVKFGLKQVNNPAPRIYSRFVNFLTVVVAPATGTLLVGLQTQLSHPFLTNDQLIVIGLVATWLLAILKGGEYLIGTDSEIEPAK
jgi:hypothetical protein